MKVKIVRKEEVVTGTLLVELAGEEEIKFFAGQFFTLILINPPYTDNRGDHRIFGFVNSPSENRVARFITRMGPSAFKKYLQEAAIGTEAEIDKIGGSMLIPEDTTAPLVIIAGGIGIAPYMSILSEIKEKSLPHKIKLVYANTNRISAPFLDQLESHSRSIPNFKLESILTGGNGLSEEALKNNLVPGAKYYISGTPRFVPAMVRTMRKLGVLPEQMKFEIFTGY